MHPRFFLLIIFMSSLFSCRAGGNEYQQITVKGIPMKVEVADTSESRQLGLMHRKSLDPDEGMLFVFEEEQKLSFWMKNTSIPLSIAYISKHGEIKEIHHMEPFSQKPVPSRYSVLYALEVNQGFFEEKGIGPGDRIQFSD